MKQSEQFNVEVARIAELTKTGVLRWEKAPDCLCTYQTLNDAYPRLVVSCCKPECYVEVSGKRIDVSCEDLIILCAEIVQQVRQREAAMQEVISLMRTINPKGGAA